MAENQLDDIKKMAPSYRKVLIEQLHLTTWLDLVLSDRQVIVEAMQTAKVKRRPSLEQVAAWQDEARRHLTSRSDQDSNPNEEPWDQKASFVVCFQERRKLDQGWERRIEVAQTEVEPPPPPYGQPGWDCYWVCSRMRNILGLAPDEPPMTDESQQGIVLASVETAARNLRAATGTLRGQLEFGTCELIDRDSHRTLTDDTDPGGPPLRCSPPARLTVNVPSAASVDDVNLAVRVRTTGRRDTWTLYDGRIPEGNAIDVDLSTLTPGDHRLTLIVWTENQSIDPALVKLPTLHFEPASDLATRS